MLIVIAVFSLAACGNTDRGQDGLVTFKGKIIELNGDSAIVEPFEGEDILSSADKVSISLADSDIDFAVGDGIIVYYDGAVMESYPAQVIVMDVEKIE